MSVAPKIFCRVCGDHPNLCGHYPSDPLKPYGDLFRYNKDVTISELEQEIQKLKEENETLLRDMKMLWRNSRSNYVSPTEREIVQGIKQKYGLKQGGER